MLKKPSLKYKDVSSKPFCKQKKDKQKFIVRDRYRQA